MRTIVLITALVAMVCSPRNGFCADTTATAPPPHSSTVSSPSPMTTPAEPRAPQPVQASSHATKSSAHGPAQRPSIAYFPPPLGSEARPSTRPTPMPPNRQKAMKAYLSGVDAATTRHDFAGALGAFQRALDHEMSSTSLFAAAQCRKAMNRPIEALFTYAKALSEDKRTPEKERLPKPFIKIAKSNMNALMKNFVAVKVVLPENIRLDTMSVRGFPIIDTDFYGQLGRNILLAGVRSRWIPTKAPLFPNQFVFYTRPGTYDLSFVLSDGRRLTLEKRRISKKTAHIDFNREALPAKLVIENIQPGTHIVVTSQDDAILVDKAFPELEKNYAVEGLKEGEYDLKVSRRGFRDYDESYLVLRGQEERVYLDLEPEKPKPIVKSWKLWAGVGAAAVAAIVTTVIVIAANKDAPPNDDGHGVVRFSLTRP